MKNRNKKIIICSILFCLFFSGFIVSYGFFEFSDSTKSVVLNAGLVDMELLNSSSTNINLNKAFPEAYSKAITKNDNFLEFNINANNESKEKIYYSIYIDYGETQNGKIRIEDNFLGFELIDVTNNKNIFLNQFFDTIDHKLVYVGIIDGETLNFSNTYKLRTWINYNVSVGNKAGVDYSFSEWNNIYASVKVTIEANNEIKEQIDYKYTLYDYLSSKAVLDDTGLENRILVDKDTLSYKYPTVYVNGYQENNNVLLAGKCWRLYTTTATGGTKMIYNGEPNTRYKLDPIDYDDYINVVKSDSHNKNTLFFEFDNDTKEWYLDTLNIDSYVTYYITFNVSKSGRYYIDYINFHSYVAESMKVYLNDVPFENNLNVHIFDKMEFQYDLGTITPSDEIKISFHGRKVREDELDPISRFKIGTSTGETYLSCQNYEDDSLVGYSKFNEKSNSPTDAGYYHGDGAEVQYRYFHSDFDPHYHAGEEYTYDPVTGIYSYEYTTYISVYDNPIEGSYFCLNGETSCEALSVFRGLGYEPILNPETGIYDDYRSAIYYENSDEIITYAKNFYYDDVNNLYHLVDTKSVWDSTNYYERPSEIEGYHYTCFTNGTTCETLNYIVLNNVEYITYVELTDGNDIDYVYNTFVTDVNKNKSTIALYLEDWYEDNLLGTYDSLIEDTVYCSNRINLVDELDSVESNWIRTGSTYQDNGIMYYSSFGYFIYWVIASNSELGEKLLNIVNTCPKDDSFTVSPDIGNGRLKYPIGLLDAKEASLYAGSSDLSFEEIGRSYWLMSPVGFTNGKAVIAIIDYGFNMGEGFGAKYSDGISGVRPVISLKHDVYIKEGTGTYSDPFIIENLN